MYPEQPQPPSISPPSAPTPPPVDYLNHIASPPPPPSFFTGRLKKVIIISLVLIMSVIALLVTVSVLNGVRKAPAEQLSARLTATQTIAHDSQKKLKSSQLRSLNSNLRLFFTNTQRDIDSPLATFGVTVDKINKSTLEAEAATAKAISQRLEDARLNAVYDRTYARETDYQLATLLTLLRQSYNNSNSASAKTFFETAYDNLAPIQKDFADFNDAS